MPRFYSSDSGKNNMKGSAARDTDLEQKGVLRTPPFYSPLFILRRAQAYSVETGAPFHLLLLDFTQAFDSIDRSAVTAAVRRTGIHP